MANEKILIVEDERSLRRALASKLKGEGYEILEAQNGQEGLSTALDQHPHVIILDVVMPNMDGTEVYKELRKDEWGKKVPVIFLSNLGFQKSEFESEQDKPIFLIKSDWSLADIVEVINQVSEVYSYYLELGSDSWTVRDIMDKVRDRCGIM